MLDESQRLHNSRAVVTQAAQDLQREYSWLLSGTPAGNVVHDLVGQLLFLGVEPWCRMGNNVHNFWDKEIAARWEEHDAEILDTLHTLLAHVMMRHSKSQVGLVGKWLVFESNAQITRTWIFGVGKRLIGNRIACRALRLVNVHVSLFVMRLIDLLCMCV